MALLWVLASCGFQSYRASPIDPSGTAARFLDRSPADPKFQQFMVDAGYPETSLPISAWDQDSLVLAALFFNPQLDIARAQWKAASANQITARQRPLPGVSIDTEKHSQSDNGVSPWTYGLAIDLPLETGGKRQARIDRATSLSEAARIEIAQSAWQVRAKAIASLIAYRHAYHLAEIYRQEVSLREAIVSMLEKRFSAGMVSNIELSTARILLQQSRQQLIVEQGRLPVAVAELAASIGLPISALQSLDLTSTLDQASTETFELDNDRQKALQEAAMLNRLDIRAALSRYAAAEAKLRLEIARQYPDTTLSPGYSYDQGDRIWSLGISSLITMIHGNKGLIAEAEALRSLEAAQFEVLQANIVTEIEKNEASYQSALTQLEKSRQLEQETFHRSARISRQFDLGQVDRLELVTTQLENLLAQKNRLVARYQYELTYAALENTLQQPLEYEAKSFISSSHLETSVRKE
jgi:outer membrane protein TolC